MLSLRVVHQSEVIAPVATAEQSPDTVTAVLETIKARYEGRDILPLMFTEAGKSAYRRRLVERNPVCVFCGGKVDPGTGTVDHAIPRCKGGGNQPWNLWLSCKNCNTEKSGRTPLEWLEALQAKADTIRSACVTIGLIDE